MQLVRKTPNWAAVILPGSTTGWVARPLTQILMVARTGVRQARAVTDLTKDGTALMVHAMFVTVATPILNIRSGPGLKHDVVALVKEKTSLQVLALTSHWAHVALPASSIDGWVLRSLTR
jgi:SH3-like domain-containing protein